HLAIQKKPGNQAYAILAAAPYTEGKSVFIVNANDFVEDSLLTAVRKKMQDRSIEASLVGYKVDSYFPGGYLVTKGNNVSDVVEKPGKGNEPSNLVRIVFDYFRDSDLLFSTLRKVKSPKGDVYEQAVSHLLRNGIMKAALVKYQGRWSPVKYPWHILTVIDHFLQNLKPKKSPNTQIAEDATLIGPVYMEEGVKIFEQSKVVGPCYLGRNVIIGNQSLVRESVIEEGSVIGFGCDVTRSYIGPKSWFHANYIGDSVIGKNVSFGSGTVTANLRLDEKEVPSIVSGEKIQTGLRKLGVICGDDVRVGVHASFMPGVKIGQKSIVGPSVLCLDDVPSGTVSFVEQKLMTKKNKQNRVRKERQTFQKKISGR
ncbi:MAG TPA: sugar phosphate nucleotidyltransferase, partial [Patescibacteria group bacterium]|nr:sugar phosphate nucleotidyltransferase [Patescibacteria group bacterium]